MQLKFYYCKHCGKIILLVKDSKTPTICCNEVMEELVPCQSDGATEKHIPIIKVSGNTVSVTVGSKLHPSETNHYIEWILLQTNKGIQQHWLEPGKKPVADFFIMSGEKIEAAFEFCNIHKLWKADFSNQKNTETKNSSDDIDNYYAQMNDCNTSSDC